MKKDLLIKGIVLPLCIGAALGVAFFLFTLTSDNSLVVSEQGAVAYFDSDEKENASSSNNTVDMKSGEIIGKIAFGNDEMNVIYDGGYSSLSECISFEHGCTFSQRGIGFYRAVENNILPFDKSEITVKTESGEYRYVYSHSFTASNENAVFSDNSIKGSGIVIYYQEAENYGFDTQYEALVYREVE